MLKLPTEYTTALEGVLRHRYPDRDIQIGSEELNSKSTHQFLNTIAKSVERITDGLTTQRGEFLGERYLQESAIREAYMVYYMTTNFLKLWAPLRELSIGGFFENRQDGLRLLDLGSGTGTALWSTLLYLAKEQAPGFPVSFLLTDALEGNLGTAREFFARLRGELPSRFAEGAFQVVNMKERAGWERLHSEKFDIITMMNALNELPEADDELLIDRMLGALSEDGVCIVLEPGTRELSRRALRFRDLLQKAGAFIFAPCVRAGGCPALERESDWCHSEVQWERPPFIEYIDDITGRLRLSLKYTYFTFGKADRNVSDALLGRRDFQRTARVVSEVFHERGRVRAFFCNETGREQYMMNLRDRSEQNEDFMKSGRYDLIELSGALPRENDVKISERSTVNRLVDSSGARIVDK